MPPHTAEEKRHGTQTHNKVLPTSRSVRCAGVFAAVLALVVAMAIPSGAAALTARASSLDDQQPSRNSVTSFARSADGTLQETGSFPTLGMGTGTPEDSANGLILANAF